MPFEQACINKGSPIQFRELTGLLKRQCNELRGLLRLRFRGSVLISSLTAAAVASIFVSLPLFLSVPLSLSIWISLLCFSLSLSVSATSRNCLSSIRVPCLPPIRSANMAELIQPAVRVLIIPLCMGWHLYQK